MFDGKSQNSIFEHLQHMPEQTRSRPEQNGVMGWGLVGAGVAGGKLPSYLPVCPSFAS